jgi:serine/threonine protein kinase/thioredoxin-like negative regulator of GroEL
MSGSVFQSLVGRLRSLLPQPRLPNRITHLAAEGGTSFRVHSVKRGGMGIVYLCSSAKDEAAGPNIALKTFDDKFFFDPQMQAAVEVEAKTWLEVSGASYVLPLLGIVTCDQKPHLMMPAVSPSPAGDVSLADEIRRHPGGLPTERCFSVACQLAMALAECARRIPDLVHGDIKPDNILLLGDAVPHLADFGAARLASQAGNAFAAQGTALYMAPECWSDPGRQDQTADIYAFGITLFEMLSGTVPFVAHDGDLTALERMHRESPPQFSSPPDGDPLREALCAFALQCLAKSPAARPPTAQSVLQRILQIGNEHDPVGALVEMVALHKYRTTTEPSEIITGRVDSLLRQGDGKTALRILQQLPSDQIAGRVLMLFGTASSLANRDEDALGYFERYLAWETDQSKRVSCMNEVGLSLKRLNRLAEARQVYEGAIPLGSREAQLMLRSNYAATLTELGETDRAVGILRQLSMHNEDSPQVWALLASALGKSSQSDDAIKAIQKAIHLWPRNGQYRLMLAQLLMEGRDISGALRTLDVAYGLGYHTKEWVIRTLACHLLLNQQEHIAELLAHLKRDISEEEARHAFDEAATMAESIAGSRSGDQSEGEGDKTSSEPSTRGTQREAEAVGQANANPQVATSTEARTEDPRAGIRAGVQPHLQTRFSTVDNSMLFDFYYGVEQQDYAACFAEAIAKVKVGLMGTSGSLQQRAKSYAFARCPRCGVVMLTQRDEGEQYACQGCGERVAVVTIRDAALDRLRNEAMTAAGLQPRASGGGTLFVAVAAADGNQADIVNAHLSDGGYARVEPKRTIHDMFAMQAHERGIEIPGDLQVWMRKVEPAETSADDGTPADLDRLLRELRRRAGSIWSMSMSVESEDQSRFMMMTEEESFLNLKDSCAANPDDVLLARTFIETATRFHRLAEAKEVLSRIRLSYPDDPDTKVAAAVVALEEGRHEEAISLLEGVLDAQPRDHMARARLFAAYQAAGRMDRARVLWEELRAHGILRR